MSMNPTRRSLLTSALGAAALAPLTAQTKRDWTGKDPIGYPDPDFVVHDAKRFKAKVNNSVIERLYVGCRWAEGPAWNGNAQCLIWSDIPNNRQLRCNEEDGHVSVYRASANYSNGNTFDYEGRQISCEHDTRRVVRYEPSGAVTVIADKFEGKRLNSPNDAVYKSDGALYFTDPPYGLPKEDDDPKKELKFNGVYRLLDGKLQLLTKELTRPNGLAFSPDEKFLYVANSDAKRKIWMRYEVEPDGKIKNGKVFYDVTAQHEDGLPDGMKVDTHGNVYATGPGGIWVISPEGKHLGTIKPPETPANLHWGKSPSTTDQAPMGSGEYATALYITARKGIYRISLSAVGIRP